MPRTNALVLISTALGLTVIVTTCLICGHDGMVASAGVSGLSLILGGTVVYTREKKRH